MVERVLGHQADLIWHKEKELKDYDCLILPGGFGHGDYLSPGVRARISPVLKAL